MKKQLFWIVVALTIFVGFLVHKDAASAQDISASSSDSPSAPSATVLDAWGFEGVTTTNTGSTPVISAGSATADSGGAANHRVVVHRLPRCLYDYLEQPGG